LLADSTPSEIGPVKYEIMGLYFQNFVLWFNVHKRIHPVIVALPIEGLWQTDGC
jgi:hypothetical protein